MKPRIIQLIKYTLTHIYIHTYEDTKEIGAGHSTISTFNNLKNGTQSGNEELRRVMKLTTFALRVRN